MVSGDLVSAGQSVAEAIAIFRENGNVVRSALALALRGEIESRHGDYAAGRASFAEALAMREGAFGPTHPLAEETRTELAGADLALGAYDAALSGALVVEKAGRTHLRFTARYLPERQAMAYAARRPHGLDLALSIVASADMAESASIGADPGVLGGAPDVLDA